MPDKGGEAMLWETPIGGDIWYLLPTPDRARALIVWRTGIWDSQSHYTLLTVRDGSTRELQLPEGAGWAVWRDEGHLAFTVATGEGNTSYLFDVDTGAAQPSGKSGPEWSSHSSLQTLELPYLAQVQVAERVLRNSDFARLFEHDTPSEAVVRGVGIPYGISDIPIAHPEGRGLPRRRMGGLRT